MTEIIAECNFRFQFIWLIAFIRVHTYYQKLLREGKLRAIGVSNYQLPHLHELETAAVAHALQQCEYHPFLSLAQRPVLDYCAAHQMVFAAYMSFGGSRPDDKMLLFEHPIVKQIAAANIHARSGTTVSEPNVRIDARALWYEFSKFIIFHS